MPFGIAVSDPGKAQGGSTRGTLWVASTLHFMHLDESHSAHYPDGLKAEHSGHVRVPSAATLINFFFSEISQVKVSPIVSMHPAALFSAVSFSVSLQAVQVSFLVSKSILQVLQVGGQATHLTKSEVASAVFDSPPKNSLHLSFLHNFGYPATHSSQFETRQQVPVVSLVSF